jgi:hypothetical protein
MSDIGLAFFPVVAINQISPLKPAAKIRFFAIKKIAAMKHPEFLKKNPHRKNHLSRDGKTASYERDTCRENES